MERQRRLRKPNPRTSQEMETQHIPPPSSQPEPSQPKVKKPRGPNKGRDAETQPSKRPMLTIVGEHEFDAVQLVDLGGAGVVVYGYDVGLGVALAQKLDNALAYNVVGQAGKWLNAHDVGCACFDKLNHFSR